ncbi:Pyruvate/Phosphoenolpyruvate kinase-like domain-containing protein [Gloeopeniophorella convolvens]|nr:Pyruvate/Phosphoenolpyruvate kinase-like domain-containing protein [Gloeopeniophorella convolvens]
MQHALRRVLKTSSPAFGAWITLSGAHSARAVASASPHLSWVTIDCEHGLTSLVPGAAETVQAIAGLGAAAPSALVRVPSGGAGSGWLVKYALDSGAAGVIVPMVGTAAQAREIAADSRFPPVGRRGLGSMFAHGVWGLTMDEYVREANEKILVIAQIETQEGVVNVEEIAQVDGLDVLFIGPFDLSIGLGYPPPSPDPHPDVEAIIQRVKTAAHRAGKKIAIFCTSGAQAAARASEGFDMVNVATDVMSMSEHVQQSVKDAVNGTIRK